MAVAVIMPRQGQSVESCIITKWHKKVGDHVDVGDMLFSYETDKASFDEEAKQAGTLLAVFAEEGDDVPVLENVAVIGEPGEDFAALAGKAEEGEKTVVPAPEKHEESKAGAELQKLPQTAGSADGAVKISPRAKAVAENMKLDISLAAATGPNGRVIERDILALSKAAPQMETRAAAQAGGTAVVQAAEGGYQDEPLSTVRKVIAKSMHASLSEMAQLTHTMSFDATEILALRAKLKENAEALGLANITLNDIILYAVSRVLKNHKELNAHFLGDKIRYFNNVNLGMAVDTPRGLLVPTIFGADSMSLSEIAANAKRLAKEAQDGKINPDNLTGGTFTISNLGAFGVESFTPVINPPQTGILGVNTIETRVQETDGQLVAYKSLGLSLTYDHRALDGAPAARFQQELCRTLENFTVLLAK